jgi:ribose transport system permease protein
MGRSAGMSTNLSINNKTNVKKGISLKEIARKLGPLLALAILSIILAIATNGKFTSVNNVMNLFRQAPIVAIMAVGQLCVILLGGIDLSVGSVLAVSISASGVAMKHFGVNNSLLLILICLVTGILFGILNGILLTRLHLPHPFISTLGTKNIARGIALMITGAAAIAGFPKGVLIIGSMDIGIVPLSFILVILTFIAMHLFLSKTALGRKIYAFGGNPEAARLAGINTEKVQVFCYAICGFFAAFAGVVYLGRMNSAVPLASLEGDLDAIAACIIGGASFLGGKGNVWGTLVGAMMITVIRNGCNLIGISSDLQQIVIGSVIIIAVFIDVVRSRMEARAKRLAVSKA